MNTVATPREAALGGIAVAAAVALWWLGSTRLALDHGADAGRSSDQALQALWVVRGLALALLGVRAGASRGWRPAVTVTLGLVAPAWPVVVLAASASAVALTPVAVAELLLLGAALLLPLIGLGLRRALAQPGRAELAGTVLGCALAAAFWFARGQGNLPGS